MTIDTDKHGAWFPLKVAADRLNVSDKTLRRRVKAGTVKARHVGTRHGPAWEVWVDDGHPSRTTMDGQGIPAVQSPELLEALRLVREQQQTIMELSGRVGYYQAQLEQATEQLALQAPMPTEPTPVVEATPAPATPPWWRRWFG